MESIDILRVADLPDDAREVAMGKLFEELLLLSEQSQSEVLRPLIQEMAEKAPDAQYHNLCLTNLKLAANLPDDRLSTFLGVRLGAGHALPSNLAERDKKLIAESLAQIDQETREKIMRNMPLL